MYESPFEIIESAKISIVFAGVGSPLKYFEFVLSILNFAKRYAEQRVIKKPMKGIKDDEMDPTDDEGASRNML